MKLLIDCDYIVYKCCAAAETEIDFGDDVILVTSLFTEAYRCVQRELDKIKKDRATQIRIMRDMAAVSIAKWALPTIILLFGG